MATATTPSLQPLYDFAARYVGRELDQGERDTLGRLASGLDAPLQAGGASPPLQHAADLIDVERQRVQASIGRMLDSMDAAARRSLRELPSADEAALQAVEASESLDALRPSTLRTPQAGETAPEQLLISQIADRLAHLVRAEVNACFDKRFGPAAPADDAYAHPRPANMPATDTGD
jgi:hypothetical protein